MGHHVTVSAPVGFSILLLVIVAQGADKTVSSDGLKLSFASGAAAITSVSLDGATVSPGDVNGGFRAVFHGEQNTEVLGANLVKDPSFDPSGISSWSKYGNGFTVDSTGGRSGGPAIKITKSAAGAYQGLTSFPSNITKLKISGWSKASGVDGDSDSDYAVYVDITYNDNTYLWGQVATFSTGTHDWEYKYTIAVLDKPVKSAGLYLLFRGSHTGSVWFDDIAVQSFTDTELTTGSLSSRSGGGLTQTTSAYNSNLVVNYIPKDSYIEVSGTLTSTATSANRAVTLTLAVPVDVSDGSWEWGAGFSSWKLGTGISGSSVDTIYPPEGLGYFDKYPMATVTSPNHGLGLGTTLDKVHFFRFGYSSSQRFAYVEVDLSLSALTAQPWTSSFTFILFRVDSPSWGWRAGWKKFTTKVFPDPFNTRVISDQGIWMPFDKVSAVTNWADFGFKFYEGSEDIPWLNKNGVLAFPYIEPTLVHLPFSVSGTSDLVSQLQTCAAGTTSRKQECQVALSSCLYGSDGNMVWYTESANWNNGVMIPVAGTYGLSGDLNQNTYGMNQVSTIYSASISGNYTTAGIYVDSLETSGLRANYRPDHIAKCGSPAVFNEDLTPAVTMGQATYDFLKSLASVVHDTKSAHIMANGVLNWYPQMVRYVDVFGTETTWLRSGTYSSMPNEDLFSRRALACKKPFLFLQNSDWSVWTKTMTNSYFEKSLMYGHWPGFFSANAATSTYFSNPTLYNRDRDLFQKYIPVLRQITKAGWEPATCAKLQSTCNDTVLVERWGTPTTSAPDFFFTLRLESTRSGSPTCSFKFTLDNACLELSRGTVSSGSELVHSASVSTSSSSFTINLADQTTYAVHVQMTGISPAESWGATAIPSLFVLLLVAMLSLLF